ncbi:MAG: sulfite exporter TauE/SafE family protein [Promethearchaeia archaeon]
MMDPIIILLFVLICIGIGLISALIGISGGMLLIPVLLFLFKFPMVDAVFMSLIGMTGLTVSAALSYIKEKFVNYNLAAVYSVLDYPGVILGGFVASFLLENVLAGLCGMVMIMLGIKLFRAQKDHKSVNIDNDIINVDEKKEELTKKKGGQEEEKSEVDYEKKDKEYKYENLGVDNLKVVAFSSFSGGVIAGMLGLGGGTIETSSMLLAGVDPKTAAGTSELSMTFTAVFAAVFHLFLGNFNGVYIWPVLTCIGTIIGAQFGVLICKKVKGQSVQKIFSLIVLYAGILMILMIFDIGWV